MAVAGRHNSTAVFNQAVKSGRKALNNVLRGWNIAQPGGIPRIFEFILAAVLAVLAARLAILIFAPLPVPVTAPDAALPSPIARNQAVEGKNPFLSGMSNQPEALSPASGGDFEDTSLNLTLTGVWSDENEGSATLKLPDGSQARFVPGDEIVTGVVLDQVYPDRVIIRRSGVREAVRFETKANSQPLNTIEGAPPGVSAADAAAGGLGEIFRLAPGRDNDGNLVIDIYAARNRTAFQALGLRDGDRLVTINGNPPPTSPEALSALIGSAQGSAEVSLVVLRDGEEIEVPVAVQE